MVATAKRITRETKQVEQALRAEFPSAQAYRYNPASIRVRIVDERFRGLDMVQREQMVQDIVNALPEETQSDITVLLLLAPEETQRSMLNVEFEHPSPSKL